MIRFGKTLQRKKTQRVLTVTYWRRAYELVILAIGFGLKTFTVAIIFSRSPLSPLSPFNPMSSKKVYLIVVDPDSDFGKSLTWFLDENQKLEDTLCVDSFSVDGFLVTDGKVIIPLTSAQEVKA